MACHLLLKNNTVSLSQPVKRKQSQNRENMHDNYFLTYDERQTAFSKNYGYLISTEYWLTFYKYYIVFWTAFIASRVSPLSGEEKRRRPGGYTFEWGLEMKQYSKATGQRVFALDMLFQVPIWRPFWKCEIDRFDHANLFDFPQKFESIIMLLDSITGHLRIVTHYHRTFNLQLSIDLKRQPFRYRRLSQADWEFEHRSILRTVLLKRSKTQDFAGKLDSKKR